MVSAVSNDNSLQRLYALVGELGEQLAANREATAMLRAEADALRSELADPATTNGHVFPGVNGVEGAEPQDNGELVRERTVLQQENRTLRKENDDLLRLAGQYETGMEIMVAKLREYAHNANETILGLHRDYREQLAKARQENTEFQQQAMQDQERISAIGNMLRHAYAEETRVDPDIVIETLQVENMGLREILGFVGDDGQF
ncbi:hypothetical protein SAICODRAFT_19473 [Saitoella complicata NRRL Y-17804]|uniref:Uncharacterized protein n=1 Tax=Saitoella complicata (strain BCRC 22490 / CBS 7301 / JCM 7358 / NBRC 10748 / NRRL Y-17804) TaxID=698492 RepID=A0A0E9NCF4_SAICN|nr:uncharacterized protein SAICODRAFT_19473 [Saitoella complicata NRRL Y-17804]ODQ52673.1 hypothetical protein SAICODRAFT_19473 [Saitoella complicata NRRL Y-17804]GAO47478.1 hypothetical protein G7K_1685-t1 [Saitoella complicata NRRL Y-17804]